ncbi:hypothetical protein, partial [Paenibacillus xylanexedens]|uniref:hypothetical protein n=1 Tax=Paenibacillus xylanexedens TaxID=528191 RepID=UPI001C92E223
RNMDQEEKGMNFPCLTDVPTVIVLPKGMFIEMAITGGTQLMRRIRPCAFLFVDSDAWPAE